MRGYNLKSLTQQFSKKKEINHVIMAEILRYFKERQDFRLLKNQF